MTTNKAPTFVTETFPYDGGRAVTVSVPADPPTAIVYAGDGQLIASWGVRLADASPLPVMIVGVHRTSSDDEMVRIGEYSPTIEPDRFAGHEQFFVHDVREWIIRQFDVQIPPGRTAICGVSASGELALALGLRHPDIYGHVFSMSPGGGYQPPTPLPSALPRFYLTAGSQEPFFLDNALRWAQALTAANADIVMTERDGDHGDPFWAEEFPRMVRWAFDR